METGPDRGTIRTRANRFAHRTRTVTGNRVSVPLLEIHQAIAAAPEGFNGTELVAGVQFFP